ncbi:MAG TPA: nickel pincer cofactor biosynthesis protein LarC [Longimicrobiaceae bacterium]|nr:nickel pincer cofactor biosynthesis protein LarC [Longimicrobiaceae bacterium]
MRALIFDPFSGISGDMTLGALLDLGLPLEWLQNFVRTLRLGDIEVGAERVDRKGIACTRLLLRLPHEHAHRHLKDVVRIIEGTGVSAEVRERAIHAFALLARAEAEVHGTTPERVHFHEVGALDAIVDVLGVAAACAELDFEAFFTRPVTLGRGWVDMAHGHFPVPPPAVMKLLAGIPVRDPDFEGECTTPTGAALLQAFTGGRTPPATFTPLANGFGAGSRDPEDRPNCLRLITAEVEGQESEREELVLLQTDIDDLSPEYLPPLMEAVLAAGALDCTAVPQVMKKGRPGVRVEALVSPARAGEIASVLFRASPSIGVRSWTVRREALARREEIVEWRGQQIRVKRSSLPGGGERAKPEFEDVVRAAEALGMPPFAAYRAMLSEGIAAEE